MKFSIRTALLTVALSLTLSSSAHAAAANCTTSGARAGGDCRQCGLGETVAVFPSANMPVEVLTCLHPSLGSSNLQWFRAGTNSIPDCSDPLHGLVFIPGNGNTSSSFICQSIFSGVPTCGANEYLTYTGTTLTCTTVTQ